MNEIEKEYIENYINLQIASNGKSVEEIENGLREAFKEMENVEDMNVEELIQEIKNTYLKIKI